MRDFGMPKLKENDIVNKEFSIIEKGYNPNEVDDLLDEIILDYKCFYDKLDEYTKLLLKYEKENNKKILYIKELEHALMKRIKKIELKLNMEE